MPKLDVLNIQPLTPLPGLDGCLYDLPSMRQRNYAFKQWVVSRIYIFASCLIIISVFTVGVVLQLLVESFGGFKDQ